MNDLETKLRGKKIEYHIIQSFPVSCLNRDDVNAPKTAIVGGTTRARVSSQCWKREVRTLLNENKVPFGYRTRLIGDLIRESCIELGASKEKADLCKDKVNEIFYGKKEKNKNSKKNTETNADKNTEESVKDTKEILIFISPKEVKTIANKFKVIKFDPSKLEDSDIEDILDIKGYEAVDALDIALFGRMVAQAPLMGIEAATSFSHAISTHTVSNEIEFFSALDDFSKEQGAGHIGTLEFNSATYYRYVSLDLAQLSKNLLGLGIAEAVEYFTKALFLAIPQARQASQSASSPWNHASIVLRSGQRIQMSFDKPVRSDGGGFTGKSIDDLTSWLKNQEKNFGSMFNKITSVEYPKSNIDEVIKTLKSSVEKIVKE